MNNTEAPPIAKTVKLEPSAPSANASAGRGGLALAAGKIFFLITGLLQQVLLKAVLGLGGYGAYSTVSSIASISYNPLVQAGIQGVSREIASSEEAEVALVQRRLLGFHFLLALLAAATFFGMSGWLASLLGAPHVVGALRILSVVLFLYAVYAPLIGFLNGRRRFLGQAGLDMMAATLRTIGLVLGAYAATQFSSSDTEQGRTILRVEGAALGFCVAGILILAAAIKLTGLGTPGGNRPPTKRYFLILVPIFGGQILLNLLFQADALLLRRFAADAAEMARLAPEAADPYVGAYRATQLFCFLPFQLLSSITFVLFPLLASAQAKGDSREVAALIARGLRIALIVGGLIISTLVAVPGGLIALVFGAEASAIGADAMRILAVGMGFFALLGVMSSAMNSLGAEKESFTLIGLAAMLVIALCVYSARGQALNSELLTRVAVATSVAMIATTIVAAFRLRAVSGGGIELLSFGRTCSAVLVAGVATSRVFTGGHLSTLLGACAASFLFLVVLVLTRELKRADLDLVLALRRR
jgi:stage V sporulation protein B